MIPYAYFYHREEGPNRRNAAFKYSLVFVGLNVILFLFGLFLKPNILPPHIDLEWFRNLLIESSKFFPGKIRLCVCVTDGV